MFWWLKGLIPVDNYITDFIFCYGIPNFFISYFSYGLYPLTWQYFGLIEESENSSSDSESFEDFGNIENESNYHSENSQEKQGKFI